MIKHIRMTALAAVTLLSLFVAVPSTAQTPVMDGINFKGATNVFKIQHNTGAPSASCTGTQQYVQDDDTTGNPFWVCQAGTMVHLGGIPTLTPNQGVAANGSGLLATVPEKGYSTVSGLTSVAWDEDAKMGKFDCRDPKYGPGGCLGTNSGQAMQDLANDLVCYNFNTGKHAWVIFPPGSISVGTATNPTLNLPAGNYYTGSSPSISGTGGTVFQASYANVLAVGVAQNLTATCNGTVRTDTLGGGSYVGFGEHGCSQGGCVNVPGDSGSYPDGGPNQTGITIVDGQYWADKLAANNNGADGLTYSGIDAHIGQSWGNSNNAWYVFGKNVAGQVYNPATDGQHCDVNLGTLDGIFYGPTEIYGFIPNPGIEYGHVIGVCWGGGITQAQNIFINRGQIGIARRGGGNSGGHLSHFRIDGTSGEGLVASNASGGDYFSHGTITNSCGAPNVGWASVGSVAVATSGSGQTPGTYTLTGSGGLATTSNTQNIGVDGNGGQPGTNAQIQVVVGAGGTVTAAPTVLNPGAKYATGQSPTFTLAAGGTPATFTVTMTQPLLIDGVIGATDGFCGYIDSSNTGINSYDHINAGYSASFGFGLDYSTGSIWPFATATWDVVPGFFSTPAGYQTGQTQTIVPYYAHQPRNVTGPIPDVNQGELFQAVDTSPITYTSVKNAHIGQTIEFIGGNPNVTLQYTAQPLNSAATSAGFTTCTGYSINLGPQTSHRFLVTTGLSFGFPPALMEQCDTPQTNYVQPGIQGLASPPTTDTQAANDTAGSSTVRAIPALPNGTFTAAGSLGPYNYCYATEVWVAGGKQTNASVCTGKTPPATTTNTDNSFYHLALPLDWTRYRVVLQSTTDGSFTPGAIVDVTTPNGLPQLPVADINLGITSGLHVDNNTIATANLSVNMTGTFNFDASNLPASSTALCVQGQVKIDPTPSTGAMYYCNTEDHWVKVALSWATF